MPQRLGNITRGVVDPIAGLEVTTTDAVNNWDGTPYTDDQKDDIILFKKGATFSKLNYTGKIDAKRFGIVADGIINQSTGAWIGGTDNSAVVVKIIQACVTFNITAVDWPGGVIGMSTDAISGHTFRIGNPLRFFGQGMGGRHFRDIIATKATVFFDISNIATTEPLFTPDGTENSLYNPLPCVEFYDISIRGQGQPRVAVYNLKTGWETVWRNVSIDYFKRGAIVFDGSYDTNADNITITRSGGLISGTPHYALTETSTLSDIANAHHFNNLHMEFCRYYIDFDICRNIYISNFKFEQFGNVSSLTYQNGVDTDLTNPMIRFGQGAWEVGLTTGMIITRQIDEWLAVNSGAVAADVPYNIQSLATALDSRRNHKFVNVDFTSPDNGTVGAVTMGSRIINSGAFGKFVFSACSFNNVSGYANGIKLKNSKLCDSKAIYIRRGTDDISGISVFHSEVTNNEIFSINTVPTPDGTAIEFLDDGTSRASKVTGNTINTYLKAYKFTGAASNQCSYTRTLLSITLTDAAYMLQMGLSSIDFTNVVIDLARIDAPFIKLQFSQNATIKTILGAFRGETITFLNDTAAFLFTFATGGTSSFSIDGQSVGVLKTSQLKAFIYTSFVFASPSTQPIFGTFISNGSGQTTINIPHGLGAIPGYTNVNAKSQDARDSGIASWTANITNISITLTVPAVAGAANLEYVWEAKL